MLNYYLGLALRSLKRNIVLTVLMICAIGVGIGTSMTTLTVFRAMSGDPIPQKSAQLFAPQIDNWGPLKQAGAKEGGHLRDQLSYSDAMGLMSAHAAKRQAAMYLTALVLTPSNPQLQPFKVRARATYTDFFPMFDVPFLYGSPWSAADDSAHADVVVIARQLNDKVFGGIDSVGKTLHLDDREYRVVGVLNSWEPLPRFYDLKGGEKYGKSEEVFLPFTRAIEAQMDTAGVVNCLANPGSGWQGLLHSECIWLQFWAELPTAAQASRYRRFLDNYAAKQQRTGRFHWPPSTELRDVMQWLSYEHVISDEVRILVIASFTFLLVCLLNAMGLMLAKTLSRAGDIGVRRALGASRGAIFAQCLIETAVVGLAGGLLGLVLTALGLMGLAALLSEQLVELTHFDPAEVGITVILATVATMLTGLYPTWRATQVQPAQQLKAQ
jgi:putative ABC transport system permease protein